MRSFTVLGLTPTYLEIYLEIVVWICDIFDINSGNIPSEKNMYYASQAHCC